MVCAPGMGWGDAWWYPAKFEVLPLLLLLGVDAAWLDLDTYLLRDPTPALPTLATHSNLTDLKARGTVYRADKLLEKFQSTL